MTTIEKRIEFINIKFNDNILSTLQSRRLTVNKKDQFILSMSWPWRAPDKSDFNSVYLIPANQVIVENQLNREGEIGIRDSEKLRIRTIAQGKSTIRFSLIYLDVSNNNSPIVKILKAIGVAVIGKLTGGISLVWKAGVETAAQYNLERIAESASNEYKYKLGQAILEFDGQKFTNRDDRNSELTEDENGLSPISLKKPNGLEEPPNRREILKLWLKIV